MPPGTTIRRPSTAAIRTPRILAVLAAWAVAAPYVARAAGLRLDVPARLEIADHVVPGLLVLACCVVALRAWPGTLRWLLAAGVALLAGLWITVTHVPLIPEALDGVTPWGAALMHLSAGPPVALAAVWMFAIPGGRG